MKNEEPVDVDRIIEIAKELGIEVVQSNKSLGIYLLKNPEKKKVDAVSLFIAIFPDLINKEDNNEGDDAH